MSLTPRLDRLQKNYIINGDMRIAQRNTSFTSPVSGQYMLDRFAYSKSGVTATHTVTQDTDVPTLAQAGYLFQNSMRFNLTAADTTINSGETLGFFQRVEGSNWAKIAQKDFTVSFWVKATLPGTYSLYALNSGEDRTYIAEYTINSANTWEKKTVNILASPSGGTWNYANGLGVTIGWTLASAGTLNAPSTGSWLTGSYRGGPNQINGVNTGATDFKITGVMLLEGTQDDPEFTTFGKTFGEELAACQRYFQKSGNTPGSIWYPGIATNSGNDARFLVRTTGTTDRASFSENLPVMLRASATLVFYPARPGLANNANQISAYNGDTAHTFNQSAINLGPSAIHGYIQSITPNTGNELYSCQYTLDAEI